MKTFGKIIAAVIGLIVLALVLALVCSIPLWLLWNWIMPVVFPAGGIAHSITLLQAFGILQLSSILFKSASVSFKN